MGMIPTDMLNKVHCMDALALLKMLPDESVNCIVTSPPYYGLRNYKVDGQIGLEDTPRAFVDRLVTVFAEARRVLRSDGVLWVNMGDSYANDDKWGGSTGGKHVSGLHGNSGIGRQKRETGLPSKSRLGIPHRLVFALQDDGWIWRDEIIWAKPNPMPESVTDRTTKAHEFVFMLTKEPRYWYDNAAIKETAVNGDPNSPRGSYGVLGQKNAGNRFRNSTRYLNQGVAPSNTSHSGILTETKMTLESRNRRSIWTIPTEPTPFAHFATFPQALIEPMILAGCPKDGVVLDPFMGSGTSAIVARRLGRNYIGSELNPEYAALANDRLLKDDAVILAEQKTGVSQMSIFELLD